MAEVENLENLTNAELRLKLIEHGLPNIPITDSSRKVLLKRLRDTILTKEATTKTGNRRETIHVSKTAPPAEPAAEALPTQTTKASRRTIAAPAPAKEDAANAVSTSMPISTRRRSMQKEGMPKEPELKSAKAASKAIPTIVLEDDEEDIDLLNAVESAEKESTKSVPIETISSRRKSRSVSVPKVTEVVAAPKKRAMTPLVEEKTEKSKTTVSQPKEIPTVAVSNNNAATQKSYQPPISSYQTFTQPTPKPQIEMTGSNWYGVYDQQQQKIPSSQPVPKIGLESNTGRYSMYSGTTTVYSSPTMRYSVGGVGSSLSAYRNKYSAADILNEQSDTDNDNNGPKSPFLSDFARTLERSKSVGRSTGGGTSGHYKRHTGSNYDSIPGRRAQNDVTFGQLVRSLNRRYHLKTIIIILAIILLSIFAYVRFYSS